jgi:hypothetical protein
MMVLNVSLFLLVAALIITILSGIGRAPLWPALLLVIVVELLVGLGMHPLIRP